eukprot:m.259761 g.259761  ORF g.259761 m.259761 type:complete len:70 (-) comp38609_c0_seq1:26-235(-)
MDSSGVYAFFVFLVCFLFFEKYETNKLNKSQLNGFQNNKNDTTTVYNHIAYERFTPHHPSPLNERGILS